MPIFRERERGGGEGEKVDEPTVQLQSLFLFFVLLKGERVIRRKTNEGGPGPTQPNPTHQTQ